MSVGPYAPHWAGVGLKASIFAEANEDDDWRERIAHGSPNYWLAQIIDFATAAGDGEPSETDPALVMQLLGAAECAMRAFLAHPDGFAEWGCNPSALETNVGMIAGIQQDARRLASDNPAHERAAAAVLNAVWFGGHLGGGALHIEARGTGPDLRPWMIAAGVVRQRGAPAAEAGDMRAAALATLAEAAAHWLEADKLADTRGQAEAAMSDLVNAAERIMREAAAVMAETREALRSKAQILVRIEGPAFRDEASLTYAGQALLLSLLDDLTGEGDAS